MSVDSAGTSGQHAGENPDSRSVRNAKKNGVDISSIVSRKFNAGDFDKFDRIYVMDQSNYRDVMNLSHTEEQRNKVELFLNISSPGKNKAVPDPWFGGDEGFQRVFDLVDETCNILIDQIKSQK